MTMPRTYDPLNAYRYGAFVQTAYLMFGNAPKSLTPPVTPDVQFPAGYQLAFYLTAVDHFGETSEREFYGFVAQSTAQPAEYVIAIRGTDKLIEWLIDAEFLPTPFSPVPQAGKVEDGFFSVYQTLTGLMPDGQTPRDLRAFIESLAPAANLTIVGHSLGGAVANLLALDAAANAGASELSLYTLAAPKTGDKAFAACFDKTVPDSIRVFNEPDIVPKVPPLYSQVNTGYEIDTKALPQIKHGIVCYHSLASYLYALNPHSTFPLATGCASGAS